MFVSNSFHAPLEFPVYVDPAFDETISHWKWQTCDFFQISILKPGFFSYCYNKSCHRIFPTMWYVGQAKAQTSLPIHTVWSVPLLVPWIFYEYQATDWTLFGVSKLKRRMYRLVWVYTCQNGTLLWHHSYLVHAHWEGTEASSSSQPCWKEDTYLCKLLEAIFLFGLFLEI